MLSTGKLYNQRIYVPGKDGAPKAYGRMRGVVFHPSELRALGVMVKRPDLALMVKRAERFAALDRIEFGEDGAVVARADDAWDAAACRRLGVDLDECVLWELMPVRTQGGRKLGSVSAVFFDGDNFALDHIDISDGNASRTLLGASNIAREQVLGYADGAIVVSDAVGEVAESGGAAAAAGEAWAKAKHTGARVASSAGRKAGAAVDKGAYRLGHAVGSLKGAAAGTADAAKEQAQAKAQGQAGGADAGAGTVAHKAGRQLGRAAGMFRGFKDEYDKARHGR